MKYNLLAKLEHTYRDKSLKRMLTIIVLVLELIILIPLISIILGNLSTGIWGINREDWNGIFNSSLTTLLTVLASFYAAKKQIQWTADEELEDVERCIRELLSNEITLNINIFKEHYTKNLNKEYNLDAELVASNWYMLQSSVIKLRKIEKYNGLIDNCIDLYYWIGRLNFYITSQSKIHLETRKNLIDKIETYLGSTRKAIDELK